MPVTCQALLVLGIFYTTSLTQDLICKRAPPRHKLLQDYEIQSAHAMLKAAHSHRIHGDQSAVVQPSTVGHGVGQIGQSCYISCGL